MMKNVYSVGYGMLERQDFKLDIVYEEPSFGVKRYLPPEDVLQPYQGQPIISLVNLDRLNNQNDPQPDGVFDFIEGFTVISSQSRSYSPYWNPSGTTSIMSTAPRRTGTNIFITHFTIPSRRSPRPTRT
jgi:cell surface protein SprA